MVLGGGTGHSGEDYQMDNMRILTHDKFIEEGYVDVIGNIPLEKMIREIKGIEAIHSPKEVIIRYDPKYDKATIYLTDQDFRKKINTQKANRHIAKLLEKI